MDTTTEDPAVEALDRDGATYTRPDGITLRLHIEPDYDTTAWDFPDLYGQLGDVSRYCGSEARRERPDWADGKARKMQIDQSGWCWWQPPADMITADDIDAAYRACRDAVAYGFSSVGITAHETLTDRRDVDHDVQIASAWLGGVDSTDDPGYLATIVSDLLAELGYELP